MGLIRTDLPPPPAWRREDAAVLAPALHRYVRVRDPIGHQVHTALAMLYLVCLPLAPALEAISVALLVGYALIRLPNTRWCYPPVIADRWVLAMLAWAAIHGLSILWSIDPHEGLTELKAFRVILLPLALWPVLDRPYWLIWSFLVGVLAMNGVQIAQLLGVLGQQLEGESRARALLHPIQTGAFNLAAFLIYFATILRTRWTVAPASIRLLALLILGGLLAAAGLVASGSRGSWVAGGLLTPALWLFMTIRHREVRRTAIIVACSALVLGAVGWHFGGSYIRFRIENAQKHLDAAEQGDYATGTGQRLMMWRWAGRFFLQSPVWGQGAGSFRVLTRQTPEYAETLSRLPRVQKLVRETGKGDGRITAAHPHSAYLHVLYATGVLGAIPFTASLVILVVRTWRERGGARDHLFADALPWVLLAWLIGTQFDCYTLNGHGFGLLAFIAALTLPWRPSARRGMGVE
ncbi:MAG: O-antigen ligase family protein [Phycisphaerales bacterium]|nr:O-antigen ligase family protein [Phycisphaerales bacterium]